MSLLKRPIFYLWTITPEVFRLERLFPSYEMIAEVTEFSSWDNSNDVTDLFKRFIRQDKKHPIASLINYRRMFLRITPSFCKQHPDWSKNILIALESIGSMYVEIATAEDLVDDCLALGPQQINWPLPIHYATSYWWP